MRKCFSMVLFFFSSRRRHTRCLSDWNSDVCSSDLQWFHFADRTMLARLAGTSLPNLGQCANISRSAFVTSPRQPEADDPQNETIDRFPGLRENIDRKSVV